MKPLTLAVLSLFAFTSASLRAQDQDAGQASGISDVKARWSGTQKPPAAPAGAPAAAAPSGGHGVLAQKDGLPAGVLETIILRGAPGQPSNCTKEPADTAKLAPELKGRYGLLNCRTGGQLQVHVIVPKSDTFPDQRIRYESMEGYALLRGRLADHYLVLQFDKQVQYLDLLNEEPRGLALAGYIDAVAKKAYQFSDANIFADALISYLGVGASHPAVTEVPKRVSAALGKKPYYLVSDFVNGELVVTATAGGEYYMVWPEFKRPDPAPPR